MTYTYTSSVIIFSRFVCQLPIWNYEQFKAFASLICVLPLPRFKIYYANTDMSTVLPTDLFLRWVRRNDWLMTYVWNHNLSGFTASCLTEQLNLQLQAVETSPGQECRHAIAAISNHNMRSQTCNEPTTELWTYFIFCMLIKLTENKMI